MQIRLQLGCLRVGRHRTPALSACEQPAGALDWQSKISISDPEHCTELR